MTNWKRKKIGEILTLQRGYDITKVCQNEGFVPVVSSSGINSYHNEAKAKSPGVVIGRKGTLGTAFYVDTDYWPHDTSLYVKDFKDNDPKFLFYLLKALPLHKLDSGSANPTLNRNVVHQVIVNVPNYNTQQNISKFLSTLDQKIELNNRINRELEGLAKLLYDYWFVQFDFPMTVEQAAAFGKPHLTGKPYKSSGGPMLHNPLLKRKIPAGWEVTEISAFSTLNALTVNEKAPPCEIHYLDLANVKAGIVHSVKKMSWSDAPSRARRVLKAGDTIVGTVRPENKSFCLVPDGATPLVGSTGFAVHTPMHPYLREFIYLSLTSETNINRLSVLASGAAYPAVNPDVVASAVIPKFPAELLMNFHKKASCLFDSIHTNQTQNQELTQLRDWLLPMLMNGQVSVGT